MRMLSRLQAGLPADPWAVLGHRRTADTARVAVLVGAAVESQSFVAVLGPRGAGKTRALRAALAAHAGVRVVEPLRLTRERLHMGDVETALVRELSDEPPRRSGEARSHQVRRVLGAASREARIVLVLDDAHVLHPNTLRALKRLRELEWMARSPLLGVVLIGQRDVGARVPEVGLRSDTVWLDGLTAREAEALIGDAMALAEDEPPIGAEAAARLAADRRARNWLDLQCLVDECLARVAARGNAALCESDLRTVLGAGPPGAPARAAPSTDAVARALRRRAA